MDETLDKRHFVDLFKARAVVVTELPPGHARTVAEQVNEQVGRGDASLRTKAEYSALFDALLREPVRSRGPRRCACAPTVPDRPLPARPWNST